MLKGLPTDREGFRVKSNTQFSQCAESYLFILRTSPLTRPINQPSPTIKRLASPYSSLTNGGPLSLRQILDSFPNLWSTVSVQKTHSPFETYSFGPAKSFHSFGDHNLISPIL